MIIPWGQWAPDAAGVDTDVCVEARNVVPSMGGGYGPISALASFGTNAPFTGSNRCVGATFVRTSSGGWLAFAGSKTKLYKLVNSVWTDYSRLAGGAYNVPTDEYWSFVQFGTKLYAVNFNDDMQVIDVDSGATNFTVAPGSPPKARYVAVVGDFLVLAALAANPRKLRNSSINLNDPPWVVGTGLCDEQEFADGGRITGIRGGELGYVVQEKALRRMIFQSGEGVAFRFERFEQEHGAASGYSLAATANGIYFLSEDGFYKFSEQAGLVPIGANRCNSWFFANSDGARFFAIISAVDPFGPRIFWVFYNSSSSVNFDRVLIYDWKLDQWSYTDGIEAQYFTQFASPGVTLESLDVYGSIDSGLIPYPFDSRIWEGGRPIIIAVGADGGLSVLASTALLTGLLRTSQRHLIPGRRAKVTSVYPLGTHNGATLSVRVGKQEYTGATQTFTALTSPSARTGIARPIASGRVHQFEETISQSSGAPWTHTQGISVEAGAEGTQ